MTNGSFRSYTIAASSVAVAILMTATALPATACDFCAVYTATIMRDQKPGVWLGLNQQFTRFGSARVGTDDVPNSASEWVQSSITQVAIGYSSGERWGMQLNVPLIVRSFRRAGEGGGIEKGHENGVGDASLVVHYDAVNGAYAHGVYVLRLIGGLKMATGDSERLGAEHADHVHEMRLRPLGTVDPDEASGVHDHDLALGSGSLDGLLGFSTLWSHDRFSLSAEVQYMLRSKGDFDYEYADDLSWAIAPGYYIALGHDYTLNVAARTRGETKGTDEQAGVRVGDSGITSVYLGPQMTLTRGLGLHVDVGVELPVYQNTSALQLVSDYRVHLGTSVRF